VVRAIQLLGWCVNFFGWRGLGVLGRIDGLICDYILRSLTLIPDDQFLAK